MLGGVEAVHIDLGECDGGIGEQRARAGGKVLQPGPHADDEIGLRGGAVGGFGSGHADRPERHRVVPRQGAASGLGFGDRDAGRLREPGQLRFHSCVDHPAAGDDQGRLGGPHATDEVVDLARIGRRAADSPHPPLEQAVRKVGGLGLDVLAQSQGGGTAGGRID
jgi:hypothetical protein